MWWVLWRSQTSRRATYQACFYARRIAILLGALVSSLWWWGHDENVFRPLPLTECCLQARDWTFLRCHLHLRSLASTTHTHNLNQQAKLGLWHLCPGPMMRISDCFLPPSRLLRLPAFRSLLSSFLAPIHKFLADIGLAPKLYGCAEVDSAPTAYVMEYLDPSTWQTLYQFDSTKTKVVDPKLWTALNTITKTLQSKKCSWGSSNRCHRGTCGPQGHRFWLRGEAGQACHPAEQYTDIQWPGEAGELIKKGHDSAMVDSWLAQELQ